MSTADHVLDQIDSALGDYAVSDDAMRCAPDLPPVPVVRRPVAGRDVLTRRLIDRHDLTPEEARDAVLAVDRGEGGVHAELVAAEARAIAAEMTARIRIALQPMAEAAINTLKQLSESLAQLRQAGLCDNDGKPARRRDRPAWQTPYGPPRRR